MALSVSGRRVGTEDTIAESAHDPGAARAVSRGDIKLNYRGPALTGHARVPRAIDNYKYPGCASDCWLASWHWHRLVLRSRLNGPSSSNPDSETNHEIFGVYCGFAN